jgi:sulfate transport system ATP-binding protein
VEGAGVSVVVQGLTKRFAPGHAPAVYDVCFEAPKGAITALLGPSGAGKSTVLRLVAGLEIPDAGRIVIDGEDCSRAPPQRRGVGFVFQSYALFEHLTVRENVAFGLSVRGMPRRQIAQKVEELLSLVQLEGLAERHPSQLSGGQRQRVAFARALAVNPRVLLLDEPFGALDAKVRVELREWLEKLHHATGVTTLLVTHDQDEAFELAQHVVVMFDGRVEQAADPHEVYDAPASPQVAAFVGGGSILRGQVRSGRADLGARSLEVPIAAPEGHPVHAVVRPEEVRLARTHEDPDGIALGWIRSWRRVGAQVKITVQMASGEIVAVHSPRSEFEALGVAEGDSVFVDLRAAKIFVGDYSI